MQWWHRLTPRGRIVVLAGTLVAAFGAAFALRDIFWLGAFAIAVVLGALALVSWPVRGLRHERLLPVTSVPVGTEFRVQLRVIGSRASGPRLLHFEDVVPQSMGMRPRFALSGVVSAVGEEVGYRLVGSERGRFRIGPLLVRSLDPFGLSHNDMAFASTTEVAVTPPGARAGPAPRRRLGRLCRNPQRAGRSGRAGRRAGPRIPAWRRRAAGALALHRPRRRTDGAARGAILAAHHPFGARQPPLSTRRHRLPGSFSGRSRRRVCGYGTARHRHHANWPTQTARVGGRRQFGAPNNCSTRSPT